MRRLLTALLLTASCAVILPVAAQTRPNDLQPLPEAPPPPPGLLDPSLEPQVTIIRRGQERVEEFRIKGKLYMVKVTPAGSSTPYYLVDEKGDGVMSRRESFESGVRVPMWVIGTF